MTEKSQISIRVFVALVATYSTLMILVFASAIPEFIADQKGFQVAGVPPRVANHKSIDSPAIIPVERAFSGGPRAEYLLVLLPRIGAA